MADDDHRARLVEAFVIGREPASAGDWHAEDLEVVGRDVGTEHRHRLATGAEAEACQPAEVIRGEPVEDRLALPIVAKVGIGEGIEARILARVAAREPETPDLGQPSGIGESWRMAQQIGVSEPEHDGDTGHADAEREHRGQREERAPAQRPGAVTEILQQRRQAGAGLGLPDLLPDDRQTAQLDRRRAPGVALRQTLPELGVDQHLERRPQFVVQVTLDALSRESDFATERPVAARRARSTSVQPSRARAMASAIRFQLACSSPNCRSPALVSV